MRHFVSVFLLLLCLCATLLAAAPPQSPVVVIAFENQGYTRVVGSPAMPYLNSLIPQGALATNYYANAVSSLPDYFMLTTGSLITTNGWYAGTVDQENLARMIRRVGKSWKAYAQSLPHAGYVGDESKYYPYVKHHMPFAYFSDVRNNPAEAARIVPIGQWLTDVANGALPHFSFVVPDNFNNAHTCPNGGTSCDNYAKLSAADQFLQRNIGPLLDSPQFRNNGLLVVWWDEGSDTVNGGGRIAVLLLGPRVKQGFRSTTFYQHQSMLRTISEALGLNSFPQASANAPAMDEFFLSTATAPSTSTGGCTASTVGVKLCSPAAGATVASPVAVAAAAKGNASITAMRVYIDGAQVAASSTGSLNASVAAAAGTHTLVVNAWESNGTLHQSKTSFSVSGAAATSCTAGANAAVTICTPAAGATIASPVTISSRTRWDGVTITATRAYVDGVSKCESKTGALDCSVALASGAHTLDVVTWNSTGAYVKASRQFTSK